MLHHTFFYGGADAALQERLSSHMTWESSISSAPHNSLSSFWVMAISWALCIALPWTRLAPGPGRHLHASGMQVNVNGYFPLEMLLFSPSYLEEPDRNDTDICGKGFYSLKADLDECLRIPAMLSQTKRLTTSLHHTSCLVHNTSTSLLNGPAWTVRRGGMRGGLRGSSYHLGYDNACKTLRGLVPPCSSLK